MHACSPRGAILAKLRSCIAPALCPSSCQHYSHTNGDVNASTNGVADMRGSCGLCKGCLHPLAGYICVQRLWRRSGRDALQSPAWIRRRDTVIAPQGSLDKHATYKGAAIWNCLRHSGAATWTVYVAVAGAGGCCECDRDSWIWQVQGVCRCVMLLGVTPISKVVGQGR